MKITAFLALCAIIGCFSSFSNPKNKPRVLVFSLTKGFRHASIQNGKTALLKMGKEQGFRVDTSENVRLFTAENLKKYKTIVLLSPTGTNVFSNEQKAAFQHFVQAGGSVVGIHAATDFCYEWAWYGKMIGAYFQNHPEIQSAKLISNRPKDKLLKGTVLPWQHTDEWYNFKEINPAVTVLLEVDESSYTGGSMRGQHPIAWYHLYNGGKIFYTALGHTEACYTDTFFLKHLLNGLKWSFK